ncbi:unnamed protein product [Candida verbasci]|uniref:RBR-type E3 ubiquitin transferase n=1 Tax=Candida verbasci TaxID=1227364 RepID=A0A9W4TTS2_9ASCO|nr:unnamed protein product [Candida verbasci]
MLNFDEDDNISFEYDEEEEEEEDDEEDDDTNIEADVEDSDDDASSFAFESDDNDHAENYKSNTTSNNNNQLDTPISKHLRDDSSVVGCNGTLYLPWSIEQFIQIKFLDALDKLKTFNLYGCSDDDLLIMLQYKKWQQEEVVNEFFDNHDKFYKKCGLLLGKDTNNQFEIVKNFSCFICCEDYKSTEVYSLTCNHQYCLKCYHHYINNEINNGRLITCIEPDCKFVIPHKDISHMYSLIESKHSVIIVEKTLLQNPLLIANARELINSKITYKWCPATDCSSFTELSISDVSCEAQKQSDLKNSNDISKVPIVGCFENHEFCFNCGYENHLPCPCWIVKKWIKKCEDDSETANWIDANTHTCPKCHTSIEKNGGCNHMTCRKCKYEFCWICFNKWSEHNNNYSCNRFRDDQKEEEIRRNKSRQTLERYLHFYKRYSIHETSMKGDKKTLRKIDEVTKIYMEDRRSKNEINNLSWIDIEFLPEAMRSLQNGRKTLKWTYCFAFYLASSNFSQIFETNQDYLNKSVEDLSEVFEKIMDKKNDDKVGTILKNKIKIINLSELILRRQKTLIKSAEENLLNGLLKFEID